MLNVEEKQIGDHTFRVTQLPAGKARKLLVRLFQVLGPSISKVLEGGASGKVLDIDAKFLSAGIETLATRLQEEDLEYVIDSLFPKGHLEQHVPNGLVPITKQVLDSHPDFSVRDMLVLVGFGLKVNFSDFLGDLGSVAIHRGGAAEPSASNSPQK